MRLKTCLALAACAACASVASAYTIIPLRAADGTEIVTSNTGAENVVPNSSYVVFTGVATAANALALLESSAPPVRDDIVLFDGISEQINDYLAVAGGTNRFVTESDIDNGNGTRTLTVLTSALNPNGGLGDLWPSGFVSGANPLTGGGWGIGLNLPDALDGGPADGLNLEAGDAILSSTIAISSNGVFAAPLNIPASLFGAAAFPITTWNGNIGLAFGNGATGTDLQDAIEFKIVYQPVPEPGTLSVLALAAAGILRRRR
ncbi:MAG TPA: PEP-CTERM sorting domain-containing protein [Tepidisphaeraceae bacterium]|nr:PEP-CTERM sorting domain-containing protein [Tepidisphaeraceae bacterium]